MGANSATTQASSKMAANFNQIKFPMSCQDASRILAPYLWEIEKKEIFEFDTIYYFNIQERIKNQGNANQPGGTAYGKLNEATNNGFDSDQQEYIVRYNEHLGYRYEVIKKLGKGSFGIVLRVFDHKQKEFLALKILKNKKRLYKQGLVESKLIETLNKNDPDDKKNIVKRLDHFLFRKHLILTFELLSVNLYDFIKMNNF
jgi:serine/threonine protein kinase